MTVASARSNDEPTRDSGEQRRASLRDLAAAYPWLPPVAGLLLVALGLWMFGELAEQVHEGGPLLGLDRRLLELVAAIRTHALVTTFGVLTWIGDDLVLTGVSVVAAVYLRVRTRSWVPALLLAVTGVIDALAVFLIKLLVARPRPAPAPLATPEDGFGFPSGHSSHSAAVYLVLVFLLLRVLSSRASRAATVTTALLLVTVVGLSRVILGVHAPSDVVAGWILGVVCAVGAVSLWSLSYPLQHLVDHLVARAHRRKPPE
ncbi:undecaprenyl-diphosphatase [Saccharopolyspora lacisalsi]|uniref:Undecaprenyl-diphosphatase n=1 Tax=Halosaccharopolyspora lacisalsi TaxID=1000566 RepID=A0A839DV47_9PSEU|nr:phosphatase PAP2 family protein [Halosaccharopolyspora lacisalsi]MBA8823165.1 undecaprenyl-diphosphatase [Halosaccharopolyspora lacisalsi]